MRDPAGELPDRLKLLRVCQLLLGTDPFGDVYVRAGQNVLAINRCRACELAMPQEVPDLAIARTDDPELHRESRGLALQHVKHGPLHFLQVVGMHGVTPIRKPTFEATLRDPE